MLRDDIASYVDLHRELGFKFKLQTGVLRHFAAYAEGRGDRIVRTSTVLEWAAEAPSRPQRGLRVGVVRRFALHMRAEDERYEVPPARAFGALPRRRRTPRIYSADDIQRLLAAAAQLTPRESTRPITYVTLLALIATTGLRISEALALKVQDVTPDGLVIRNTKFRKSRLVPLHPSARQGIESYLAVRRKAGGVDDSVFVSLWGSALSYSTVYAVFLSLMRSVGLRAAAGTPGPRLHDLRHTFAVRALEGAVGNGDEIARHILALSTYLGHAHPSDTYWYLQATPALMQVIATVGEAFFERGDA